MEKEKLDLDKELQLKHEKIVKELLSGKDITLKVTPKGLKVQAAKVTTIE
jgi:hypothetical protein